MTSLQHHCSLQDGGFLSCSTLPAMAVVGDYSLSPLTSMTWEKPHKSHKSVKTLKTLRKPLSQLNPAELAALPYTATPLQWDREKSWKGQSEKGCGFR